MDAMALTVDGGDRVVAMACGKCGTVHSPLRYVVKGERAMEAARNAADECCAPRVCECGAVIEERYYTACRECRDRKDREREAARRAAATVVKWDDDAGEMLYDPHGDRFVSELWEIEEGDDPPPYAYATRGQALHLDAEDILEQALTGGEHYDEARADIADADVADLQAYLDAWCKRTRIVSWSPDFSRVVVFDTADAAGAAEEG